MYSNKNFDMEGKEAFYAELNAVQEIPPKGGIVVVLSNLNANRDSGNTFLRHVICSFHHLVSGNAI